MRTTRTKRLRNVMLAALLCLLPISMSSGVAQATVTGDVGSWQTSGNALPDAARDTASATYNGYVYLVGGAGNSSYLDTVSYAKMNSNGTIDAWQTSGNTLPQPLAGPSAVAYNGYLYVMGGFNGGATVTTVYYAQLNVDGSIGAWQTSGNSLPTNSNFATAVTNNGYVYYLGGINFATYRNTVYYAQLNGDGSVGSWQTGTPLPQARTAASSFVYNGYVYEVGGLLSGAMQNTVYYAQLNGDGSVGSWQTSSNTLPQALGYASGVVNHGHAYIIGGYTGSTTLSNIYYASFSSDGDITTWQSATNSLPVALRQASAASNGNFLYYIGGYNGSSNVDTTYFAEVYVPPDPTSDSSASTASGTSELADTGQNQAVVIFAASCLLLVGCLLLRRTSRKLS